MWKHWIYQTTTEYLATIVLLFFLSPLLWLINGSAKSIDIPLQWKWEFKSLFNITYCIVSQIRPYISSVAHICLLMPPGDFPQTSRDRHTALYLSCHVPTTLFGVSNVNNTDHIKGLLTWYYSGKLFCLKNLHVGKPPLEQCHSPCDMQVTGGLPECGRYSGNWLLCPDLLSDSDSQETNRFDCITDANTWVSFIVLWY